jgi:hypothetical protein
MNLLKSYFNGQIKHKLLKIKTKPMASRFRRLSAKRVFIGKGELKHISSRVVITFYVYNTEGMFLSHKVLKLRNGLYFPKRRLEKKVTKDSEGKRIITYNRLFTLLEYLDLRQHYEGYFSDMISTVNKLTSQLDVTNKYYNSLTSLVQEKILSKEERLLLFNKKNKIYFSNYPDFNVYLRIAKEEYWKNLYLNFKLLQYNKVKFTRIFFSKLLSLVQKIYNKKVEFNIVNLKKMHLNSDIYTQAVSLKLRNRDNKLYRVLKASLRKIKLPIISKIDEKQKKPNRDVFIVNKIRNNIISTMFINNKKNNNNDRLENLLLEFFPLADDLEINIIKRSSIRKRAISLKSYILRSIKHLKLRGIRIEAKGRLTRRFTASRSVFKMKWKGGLKNVESSFRGLSAIMLRGIVKSNIQYSSISSKNRNGAFGVKGWVSSK